jgi:chromosome segregation ATPase
MSAAISVWPISALYSCLALGAVAAFLLACVCVIGSDRRQAIADRNDLAAKLLALEGGIPEATFAAEKRALEAERRLATVSAERDKFADLSANQTLEIARLKDTGALAVMTAAKQDAEHRRNLAQAALKACEESKAAANKLLRESSDLVTALEDSAAAQNTVHTQQVRQIADLNAAVERLKGQLGQAESELGQARNELTLLAEKSNVVEPATVAIPAKAAASPTKKAAPKVCKNKVAPRKRLRKGTR